MILKRRVALGGVQLDELDSRIIISGLDEAAGRDTITAVANAEGFGQRITGQRRDTLDVTVKFQMAIKNGDMEARSELLDLVNGWASAGGWLTVGHRPGKRLLVVLAQAPGGGDMFNWANEFTIVFRAYSVPFWADREETTAVGKVTASGSVAIDVPGNTDTVAGFVIENKSGAKIDKVTINAGGNKMTFTGLAMMGNEILTIDHVQKADVFYLRAKVATASGGNERSVLYNRSGADDFYVKPGAVQVNYSADRAIQPTVSVRGRYL